MALSDALAGKYADIFMSDETPPDVAVGWTLLSENVEIGEFPLERMKIDVTAHGESVWKERILGPMEEIDLVLTCNYTKTTTPTNVEYDELRTMVVSPTASDPLRWFKLVWPDATDHTFAAFVAGLGSLTPRDEQITYTLTLAVTDAITRT